MTRKQHNGAGNSGSNRPAGKGLSASRCGTVAYGDTNRWPEYIETLFAECEALDAASIQASKRLIDALIAERDGLDEAIAQLEREC